METRTNPMWHDEQHLVWHLKNAIKKYYVNTGNFENDFECAINEFYEVEPYYFSEWQNGTTKKMIRTVRLARCKIKNEYVEKKEKIVNLFS